VDVLQTIVERWGFPAFIVVWLMRDVMREMRAQRAQITKLVVVNSVILKTLDIPEAEKAAVAEATAEDDKDDKARKENP